MRLAVLSSPDSWYFRDLHRAAAPRHEITSIPFRRLWCGGELGSASRGVRAGDLGLSQYDAVLIRSMPPGSLEQIIFRMDVLGQLEAAGTLVVNPPRAIESAVDKFLTTARLATAGLPTPRTATCQSVEDALAAFDLLGGDVVLKPIFGSEGRGIARLQDPALAERAFRLLVSLGSVVYLQEFVPHNGWDVRLLVIGKRVLAMRRANRLDWRTNISRGAIAEAIEPSDEWIELARRAADVVGAPLAGVDLLLGRNGQIYVIEVNAVPGWRALAEVHRRDVAALVLDYIATAKTHEHRR